MNIGIVCYPTYGGSGVVATELGKALARKGHFVHFITYQQPVRLNDFTQNISYHEVRVMDYPLFDYPPYELVLSSKLVDVVKHEKLDLLHVHYAIPHASAAYIAQRILESQGIKIPFITTLHGTDITLVGKDPSFEPVITFAINQSNAVTTVSHSLKEDTLAHFEIKRNIEVIPNFICIEECLKEPPDEVLKKSMAPNGEKLLIHVSNFRKVKRVQDVLKIFENVLKVLPTKLLLVGDGPERVKLEEYCREKKLEDKVYFLGKVKDTNKLLSIADLFLLTSKFESFGLAALEAMAVRVPVISTNTGGLSEVNIQAETGFLSDVGNVKQMSANALKLLMDPLMHQEFKENAYQQALKFDLLKVLPQYEELYNRVISNSLTENF